jgi:hypothetical protein
MPDASSWLLVILQYLLVAKSFTILSSIQHPEPVKIMTAFDKLRLTNRLASGIGNYLKRIFPKDDLIFTFTAPVPETPA